MKDNPQRLFDRKSEKEYWKKTPWKKIWKKIRERIFEKKSVIEYLKEYSKEHPRKRIRKKIREKIFERKSRIFFCIFFREGYSYAYAMKALIPLSIRLPPPLMASFISRFIEKSKNKGNPLESCLLLRRLVKPWIKSFVKRTPSYDFFMVPHNHIWMKIRERIFKRKSAKEYSRENPRKNLWAKIRENSLEKKSVKQFRKKIRKLLLRTNPQKNVWIKIQ